MDRRAFLSAASAGLAGTLLPAGAPRPAAACGVQMYTVQSHMGRDPAGTLDALAAIGYREVELAGLYGASPAGFRRLLDASGLVAPAAHIGLEQVRDSPDRVFEEAARLGNRWVIVPYLNAPDRTRDGMLRVAGILNEAGRKAAPLGIRLGYHNHEFEFTPLEGGKPGLDLLLENTDRALVDFELDLFWIRRGQADALAYFSRFPGRFVSVHVKDMSADGRMVNVGAGVIDFAAIFRQSSTAGIKHYFVEHDQPADPMNDVRASYTALRRLLS